MEIKRPIHFYSHSIIDIFVLETRLNTNFGRFIDVPSRFSRKIIEKTRIHDVDNLIQNKKYSEGASARAFVDHANAN